MYQNLAGEAMTCLGIYCDGRCKICVKDVKLLGVHMTDKVDLPYTTTDHSTYPSNFTPRPCHVCGKPDADWHVTHDRAFCSKMCKMFHDKTFYCFNVPAKEAKEYLDNGCCNTVEFLRKYPPSNDPEANRILTDHYYKWWIKDHRLAILLTSWLPDLWQVKTLAKITRTNVSFVHDAMYKETK